ncbi:VCBS domain-containing protein [Pseudorhodoplanes sinuspersici]|uniref:Uncharacterized protein n=1 Tax=Pseudorhodoplanes sinuspersici TaxID=1235591 RepID=A0A1W6ZQF9_9HYPH|nr:VCBS domain-containing protein [Pseudorhodoplanes sinuspersici]ARP99350.1 hypothetical protein CAK95_09830 [Pseudorhodoplanes sinuspersici]RKE70281.1 FecR family protein [Pseudorhodoplanes sinuspersici]
MLDAVLALNETDMQVFDFASQAAPPAGEPAGHITVPDAHLLFNGEFKRVGTSDLKIVGDDGASFFIRDYFATDKLSHLISPEGATLSASVVAALAGPLAPGQSAQAGAQQAAQPVIGRVDALSGSCNVIRNGVSVALNIGDTVRKGDVVQTAGGSAVAIVFADGSTFSLNANARMVLDDFVYNAGGAGNSALISLVQGTFSFVAGQVAKTGDMRVDTPVATMGIRGTAVLVEISANDGQTRFSVMVEPDGTTGSFNIYDRATGSLIGTVNNAGVGWLLIPSGPLQVVAQQVQKTPAQLQQENAIVQQIFTIFNNNQQNPFVPDQQQQDDPSRRGDNPNDPNPQTAQGGGGGSGGLLAGGDPSLGSSPGIVNGLPQPGTYVFKLPPLPGVPPPVIPGDTSNVVTVVVTPNKPPVAVNDPDGSSGGGDVTENDSDPEGGSIVVASVRPLPDGERIFIVTDETEVPSVYGKLIISPDGTYSFVPNEAFAQFGQGQIAEQFEYTIRDPFGATASAVLTIKGVNDAPEVTGAITGEAIENGEAITLDALANASDIDIGTTLSVVNVPETLPPGVTYDTETHSFTLDPSHPEYQTLAAGEQITVQVSYAVFDGFVSIPASVSWTVTGTNDAPTAHTDTNTVAAAGQLGGEWTLGDPLATGNVLANDTDPDEGGSLTVVGVRAGDHPEGVTGKVNTIIQGTYGFLLLKENGSYIYTLNNFDLDTIRLSEGETGTEIFTYTIQDSDGLQSTTTLTIDVHGANNAPVISGGSRSGSVTEDAPVNSVFGTLTKIDVDNDDTADNDVWSVEARQGQGQNGSHIVHGTYGTLNIDQTGQWTYTLDNTLSATQALQTGDAPTEIFTVRVTDSHGASDTQTIRVTVHGVDEPGCNQPPVISVDNISASTVGQHTTFFGLRFSDADDNGEDLYQVTITSNPEHGGTLSLGIDGEPPNNTISFTETLTTINQALQCAGSITYWNPPPQNNHDLIDTITVSIVEKSGGIDTANFIFNVFDNNHTGVNLVGTDGKDVLFGTGREDSYFGGAGSDLFVFKKHDASTSVQDVIVDFTTGEDKIALYDFDAEYVLSHITYDDLGARIDLGNNQSILLPGYTDQLPPLSQSDFIFHQNGFLLV